MSNVKGFIITLKCNSTDSYSVAPDIVRVNFTENDINKLLKCLDAVNIVENVDSISLNDFTAGEYLFERDEKLLTYDEYRVLDSKVDVATLEMPRIIAEVYSSTKILFRWEAYIKHSEGDKVYSDSISNKVLQTYLDILNEPVEQLGARGTACT